MRKCPTNLSGNPRITQIKGFRKSLKSHRISWVVKNPSKCLVVPTICNTLSFVNFRFQLIRSARLQSHFSEALYFESAMAAHVSSPESRTGQTQHLIFASLSQLDFRVYEELLQFVNLCLSFSDPRSQLLLASPTACRHRYSTSSIELL